MLAFKKLFLVLFTVVGAAIIGFSTYFTVLYFNRETNHRFEAAYIYDLESSQTVDVDLGIIYPGESVEQGIKVISKIEKDTRIKMNFGGQKSVVGDFIEVVCKDDETNAMTLNEAIENNKTYQFQLGSREEKEVVFVYKLLDMKDVPTSTNCDFLINIVATDVPYIHF